MVWIFVFCFFNIVELVSNQLSTGHFRCHCLWKLLIILLKGINLINNVGICVFVIAAGWCVILYQVMVFCLIHQITIESSYHYWIHEFDSLNFDGGLDFVSGCHLYQFYGLKLQTNSKIVINGSFENSGSDMKVAYHLLEAI